MSKIVGNKFYISEEPRGKCEYCGKVAELRPYGKNRANICFECGMKDEEITKQVFAKHIEGVTTVIVGNSKDFN